jgi:hypothetical protein
MERFPETTKQYLYYLHRNGHKYIKKIGTKVHIDYCALRHRRDFRTKIANISQDNYYKIDMPEYALAKELAKRTDHSPMTWVHFMRTHLFSSSYKDMGLTSYKTPKMLWEFYKITKSILKEQK